MDRCAASAHSINRTDFGGALVPLRDGSSANVLQKSRKKPADISGNAQAVYLQSEETIFFGVQYKGNRQYETAVLPLMIKQPIWLGS